MTKQMSGRRFLSSLFQRSKPSTDSGVPEAKQQRPKHQFWEPTEVLGQLLAHLSRSADIAAWLSCAQVSFGGLWGTALIEPHFVLKGQTLAAERLGNALADCLERIARFNMAHAVQWFSPFWDDVPSDFAGVSSRSICWALWFRDLERSGVQAAERQDGLRPFLELNPPALLGDMICLHGFIERLAVVWNDSIRKEERGKKGRDHVAEPPAEWSAETGGLRKRSLLSLFGKLLATAPQSELARLRLEILRKLLAFSPLTQVVYLDLWSSQRPLTDVIQGGTSGLSAYASPLLHHRGEAPWWRDLWYSHLARSLVAALHSPPVPLGQSALSEPDQYLARLAILVDAFSGGERAPASYLQARLLDMLVRNTVTRTMPKLMNEWAAAPRSEVEAGKRQRLLASDKSPVFRQWTHTLLGDSPESVARRLKSVAPLAAGLPNLEWLHNAVVAVHETGGPPLGPDPSLARRFADEAQGGVELANTNHPEQAKTFPPARLLEEWLPLIMGTLK